MTFWGFVIISGVIAALELIFVTWWGMRQPLNSCGNPKTPSEKAEDALTLKDLIIGLLLVVCPIVNTLVAAGVTLFIFVEITPKIVLFGKKPS